MTNTSKPQQETPAVLPVEKPNQGKREKTQTLGNDDALPELITSSIDSKKHGCVSENSTVPFDTETVISTVKDNSSAATNACIDFAPRPEHAISSIGSDNRRNDPEIDSKIPDTQTVISTGRSLIQKQ